MTTAVTAVRNEPASTNLIQKLAAVMAQVEKVPKNGHNDFYNYDYATEADITDAVRSAMAQQGVMLIPSVEDVQWKDMPTKSGAVERLATLRVCFTVTDGVDKMEFRVLGEGQDRSDKATYKAMTGATKYAILKLFLIPTGNDPETEGEEKPHTGVRAAPAGAPAPAPKPPPPYVAALWKRCFEAHGKDKAKAKWDAAAYNTLGDPNDPSKEYPPSRDWTKEQAEKVEQALFPVGVPF